MFRFLMGAYQSPNPQTLPLSSVKKLSMSPFERGDVNLWVTSKVNVPLVGTSTEGRLMMTLDSIGRNLTGSFFSGSDVWLTSVAGGGAGSWAHRAALV